MRIVPTLLALLIAVAAMAQEPVATTVDFESVSAGPTLVPQNVGVRTPEGARVFFFNCVLTKGAPEVPGDATTVVGSVFPIVGPGVTMTIVDDRQPVSNVALTLLNGETRARDFNIVMFDSHFRTYTSSVTAPARGSIRVALPFDDLFDFSVQAVVAPGENYSYFIDDVTFTFVPLEDEKKLQVEAQNTTFASLPESKPIGGSVVARIALGSRFTLRLNRLISGVPLPVVANFGLGLARIESELRDPTLYPTDALLEFDRAADSDVKSFQAVHLGAQDVVITPADSTLSRQVVTVQVVRPASLGSAPHQITVGNESFDLDDEIVTWSHRRGIPPQIVKGIMKQETLPSFNPKTWRYEPLTTDWDGFSPLGNNARTLSVYAPYRMEYDEAHPRGALLVDSEDVHPRSVFYRDRAHDVKLADADELVTAATIVKENESWQHWLRLLQDSEKKALLAPDLIDDTLSWTSQTTIASSYGLMQVLYEEAVIYGAVINGTRRPYNLFDIPANVRVEGGSMRTGTGLFADKFLYANRAEPSASFAAPADLDTALLKALSAYNGTRKRGRITAYGRAAFAFSEDYLPVPQTSIFP